MRIIWLLIIIIIIINDYFLYDFISLSHHCRGHPFYAQVLPQHLKLIEVWTLPGLLLHLIYCFGTCVLVFFWFSIISFMSQTFQTCFTCFIFFPNSKALNFDMLLSPVESEVVGLFFQSIAWSDLGRSLLVRWIVVLCKRSPELSLVPMKAVRVYA